MHYLEESDYTQGKNDNKDQTLLREELFRRLVVQEGEFWKEIKEAKEFVEEEVKRNSRMTRRGMEIRRKDNVLEGKNLCFGLSYPLRRDYHEIP